MAKLYYYYGAMNASKTLIAQGNAYNYIENEMSPLVVNGVLEGRQKSTVDSRPGISIPAVSMETVMAMTDTDIKSYDIVIVDAAEQLTKEEIDRLTYIVDELNIPVVCYGLRTDYKGNLFPAAGYLFSVCDNVEEIKTICWCGAKAIMTAKVDENGRVIQEETNCACETKWIALCRKHYKHGITSKY